MTKLKAPAWKKDAVADVRGWRHPKTGELLKRRAHKPEDVAEFNAAREGTVEEAPIPTEYSENMKKAELVAFAESLGVDTKGLKKDEIVAALFPEDEDDSESEEDLENEEE